MTACDVRMHNAKSGRLVDVKLFRNGGGALNQGIAGRLVFR